MDIERFISEHKGSPSGAFTSSSDPSSANLPWEVCQAANRGWRVFPVNLLAKLTGNTDLLIGEASCNLSRLKELSAEYSPSEWRVALGPSSLCVLKIAGPRGRNSVVTLSKDQEESVTLRSRRGDTIWAFFRWPVGLVFRPSASKLPLGVTFLTNEDSCPIPPSGGCVYLNPWEEVQALPCWLKEIAGFEDPDDPPGKVAPAPSHRPAPCRHKMHSSKPPRAARKGYSISGQIGKRLRYRISRRL